MQQRLKIISGVALGSAVVFGGGSIAVAKSNAARGLTALVILIVIAVCALMVAAGKELAHEIEAQREEAQRARNRQLAAMQEQKEIQERWHQVEFFSNLLKAVASLRDVDSVIDAVLDRVMGFLHAKAAFVMLGDPDEGDLYVEHAKSVDGDAVPNGRVRWGEGIAGRVALTGEPVLTSPGDTQGRNKGSLLCVPLKIEDRSIGCMTVEQPAKGEFSSSDLEFLTLVAQETGLSIERARLYSEMEELSITDPLTRLHNRRYLDSRMTEEFARAKRHQRPMSVVMLDIDHFKRVNDTHGHAMGDTVLQGVAKLIREQARSTDLPARYGGEEFIIVSPDSTREDGLVLAERLRQAVEAATFVGEGENSSLTVQVTISLGIAALPQDAEDHSELIEKADAALYRAKESGRNRVCSASNGVGEEAGPN